MIAARSRLLIWGACLLLALLAPFASSKGFFLSLLCRIGTMTIFALSYNMLLGQTGLLSFGHAVHFGLGAFATLHLLNAASARGCPLPITLLPLAGGLAGGAFAAIFGPVMTRRPGTTFAMISLGIGEMVAASSLMFPAFFGGEGGISGNRVTGKGLFGITYGPQIQVYYLIAGWALLCLLAMYGLTRTPLGRLANAVRDNPERVQFIGYSPQRIRTLMLVFSSFFAGIAGGLLALQLEIVTAETLSDATSGLVILMVFVGGIGAFHGPILGAILITVLQIAVASVTPAWPFYFGLFFVVMVLYAPGGIAGILAGQRALFRRGLLARVAPSYLLSAVPAALLLGGVIALVEMAYAMVNREAGDTARIRLLGFPLDGTRALCWVGAAGAAALGLFLLRATGRVAAQRWMGGEAAAGAATEVPT